MIKKFLAVFLSAVIAGTGMCINANAGGEKKKTLDFSPSGAAVRTMQTGDIESCWKVSYSGYDITITGFDEELYALAHPEYNTDHILYLPTGTDGYKVTTISTYAFSGNSYSFTKVIIPNTLKRICWNAFSDNTVLEEVELQEGSALVELNNDTGYNSNDGCFTGCMSLKRIGIGSTDALPESLEEIDPETFYNCKSLKSIDLSQCKVTSLSAWAFEGCSSLEKITFPKNLYSIEGGCFKNCENLTEVSLPATLQELNGFYGCTSLKSVHFETFGIGSNRGYCSLKSLGTHTFENCINLTDVQFAESINSFEIPYSCFENTGLRSIDIPSCVTEIENNAFAETKLANAAFTKSGDAYSVGIFGNPTISSSVFGNTYDNVSPNEVPKIAGHGTDSNAYVFTVKKFGPEFFVDLGDYNPFHYPHTIETIPRQEPTCMDYGLTEIEYCTECGKILKYGELIPKADHTPETIPGKAATCTQEGLTAGERCSVCGEIITPQQEIPLAEHTPKTIYGRPATCTLEGLTDGEKCSVCGEILKEQTPIPKSNHVYVNGVCTVCGEEQPTMQITIGDIDEDGVITSADALILLRYSVGLSADDEVGKTYYVK